MRVGTAALAALFVIAAPAAAQEQPGWSYAYVDGVATASERNERGDVIATITCRPPDGDIILTDYSFRDSRVRRAERVDVRIGAVSVNIPVEVERARGNGRRHAVIVHLPQRPPILAAVQPNDQLSISIAGQSRTLFRGAPQRMEEVAFACWQ